MYGNFLKYFHSLRNYSSSMRAIRWSHIVFWRVTASIWRSITSLPSHTSPNEMLMCYSCMVYSLTQPISSLSAKIELCVSSRNSLQLAWEHFRFLFFGFLLIHHTVTLIFVLSNLLSFHAAYLLVNNGFDVWLANSRGSDYGLEHKTLDINSDDFWNFSFHEIGVYDLRGGL